MTEKQVKPVWVIHCHLPESGACVLMAYHEGHLCMAPLQNGKPTVRSVLYWEEEQKAWAYLKQFLTDHPKMNAYAPFSVEQSLGFNFGKIGATEKTP